MVLPHREGHSGFDNVVDRLSAQPLSRELLRLDAGLRIPLIYQRPHPQESSEVMAWQYPAWSEGILVALLIGSHQNRVT